MTFTFTIIWYWVQEYSVFFASLWWLHWTRPVMNAARLVFFPFWWPPSTCRKYPHIPRSDPFSEVGWLQSSIPLPGVSQSTISWTLFLLLTGVTAATERSYWLVDPGLPLSRGERGSNQDTPRLPSKWWVIQSTRALSEEKLFLNIFYKSLPSFHLPVPFYVFHLAEEYKNSRMDSYSCLLTSAYDHLKPHVGNFHVLYMSGWLKIFFNILQ